MQMGGGGGGYNEIPPESIPSTTPHQKYDIVYNLKREIESKLVHSCIVYNFFP